MTFISKNKFVQSSNDNSINELKNEKDYLIQENSGIKILVI